MSKVSQKSTVLLRELLDDEDAEAVEDVFEAEADCSFHGRKCSEKGLASEINTSKVCLQTTAEAPGCMEMVEVIEAAWPPLFLPPLLPAQKKKEKEILSPDFM